MAKSSDNIRCIRKYPKKDGTFSFHAEVRRKGAKPLRQVFRTLTEAKNWVRSNETAILEGKLPQEVKARKYTVNDAVNQAVDRLKATASKACDTLICLLDHAESESVRHRVAVDMLNMTLKYMEFKDIEHRIRKLEDTITE